MNAWPLGWAAAGATLPYLALKSMWLAGSTVGMNDPAALENSTYRIANLVTLLLQLVAATVAIALTSDWGQRLPAWLLLVPMWAATGLLGTVLVLVPLAAPFAVAARTSGAADSLAGWVYAVVYGAFTVQGILLLIAFSRYTLRRWPVLRCALAVYHRRHTRAVHRALLAAAATAAANATLQFSWSVRPQLARGLLADRFGPVDRMTLAVHAAFTLAAAIGILMLTWRRPQRAPLWLPIGLAWTGTASMLTWGSYSLALDVWNPSLSPSVLTAAHGATVGTGLAIVVCAAMLPWGLLSQRPSRSTPTTRHA